MTETHKLKVSYIKLPFFCQAMLEEEMEFDFEIKNLNAKTVEFYNKKRKTRKKDILNLLYEFFNCLDIQDKPCSLTKMHCTALLVDLFNKLNNKSNHFVLLSDHFAMVIVDEHTFRRINPL